MIIIVYVNCLERLDDIYIKIYPLRMCVSASLMIILFCGPSFETAQEN